MNKTLINLACISLVFMFGEAYAQSFTPGMNVAEDAKKSDISPSSLSEKNSAVASDDKLDKAEAIENEGRIVNTVEKKFDSTDNTQEEYDNSKGKVFQFRIVDPDQGRCDRKDDPCACIGKVIFDDERKILISYDSYKVEKGLDGIVRCSMRIYVLNDLTTHISSLGVKLKWPQISTNVQMNKVNPGVKTYMDVMLLGDGCLSMDKTPTIEVNRCRVKGMSEEQCSNAIRWFKANQ